MIRHLCAATALAIGLTLAGCGASTEDLAQQVRRSMEETFAQDATTRHVQIKGLSLNHVEGERYQGLLQTLENGEEFSYPVEVIYDGHTPLWELQQ